MLVVMIGVALAVLAGVVVVAVGRGGELAHFPSDHPPLVLPDRDRLGASDVALLRLPGALWGYDSHATDAALRRIGDALTARDTRIAMLERQVTELGAVPVQAVPHRPLPAQGAEAVAPAGAAGAPYEGGAPGAEGFTGARFAPGERAGWFARPDPAETDDTGAAPYGSGAPRPPTDPHPRSEEPDR